MDNTDIFHEAVSDEGGRLDTASLGPDTAAAYDYVAQRARGFLRTAATALPEMPPIHFDFVYRGAVATLGVLFDRMLADPEILPFIGAAEQEAAGSNKRSPLCRRSRDHGTRRVGLPPGDWGNWHWTS